MDKRFKAFNLNQDDITILTFKDVVTKAINQSLKYIKDSIKASSNQYLHQSYDVYVQENKKESFEKNIQTISRAIARDITEADSGVSQMLQALDKYVETYNNITSTKYERTQAEEHIEEYVKKINEEIFSETKYMVNQITEGIDYHVFHFETLIKIKQIGWKTLSQLYLSLKDNTSSDEPYVQGYLEFEIFRHEAMTNQKLWLTYSEIQKPLFEIINEGMETYDVHEIRTIANQTIDTILNNENYVKHVKMSTIQQEEPCYASATLYQDFYDVFNDLTYKVNSVPPIIGDSEDDIERLDEIIREVEVENGFDFTLEQKQAIYASCQHSVFSLTGYAGTGKSTSVKAIVRIYEKLGYAPDEIMGTSFTGLATYNLRQSVNLDASQCATMHRWIICNEFVPKNLRPVPSFEDVKLLIIDEFSMVGLELMKWALSHLKYNHDIRILFVGDIKQLPSITLGFAYDFVRSDIGQQIELTQVVRQGEDSIVPLMANKIRESRFHHTLADENYRGSHFRFLSRSEYDNMVHTTVKSYLAYERKYNSLSDIQIIANTNGLVMNINQHIQEQRLANETLTTHNYLQDLNGETKFYINDRIMIVKNMIIASENDKRLQIFNGAKGSIQDIELKNESESFLGIDREENHFFSNLKSITIQFDSDDLGTQTFKLQSDITKYMRLAYATTIHKAQGSTIPNVIMVVGRVNSNLNSTELIYTGLTRTSDTLTLISSANTIKKAVSLSGYANARTIYQDVIKSINQNQ